MNFVRAYSIGFAVSDHCDRERTASSLYVGAITILSSGLTSLEVTLEKTLSSLADWDDG